MNIKLPEREKILDMIKEVGLEADVIRWGFRSVVPPEKARLLAPKILAMRRIVNDTLRHDFENMVEFYNAEAFLEYSTIGQNIIFGEYPSSHSSDHLLARKSFQTFLKTTGLDAVLLELGRNIADTTVNLLRDMHDDEYFFQGSPMEPDEFDFFQAITRKLKKSEINHLSRNEHDALLKLALLYIPGKHKIFTITEDIRATLLQARNTYLTKVEKINLEQCRDGTIQQQILPLAQHQRQPEKTEEDFIPFCSSQYLYRHTLMDNVLFGTVIDREAIRTQLSELAIRHFSEQGLLDEILAIGLEFHVGSKGDNLSGGQKQKVALARALLKATPLLILDEATASLDNSSQTKIQRYIDNNLKGNTTVVAVVHRLDMISGYDHIIVMKAGKIVESGTYDDLLQEKGVLHELISENAEN
jgi:ABC-type phosphate/phosphonate transport system ATPase subunit